MISNQLKPNVTYAGVPEPLLEAMVLKLRKLPYDEVVSILAPIDFFGAVIPLPQQPAVVQPQPGDVPVPPAPEALRGSTGEPSKPANPEPPAE
jgi:hypothetical protein